jgi:hypothetical protein
LASGRADHLFFSSIIGHCFREFGAHLWTLSGTFVVVLRSWAVNMPSHGRLTPFDMGDRASWTRWAARFEAYCRTNDITEGPAKKDLLGVVIGDEGYIKLETLASNPGARPPESLESIAYDVLMGRMRDSLDPAPAPLEAIVILTERRQLSGESAIDFLAQVRLLATHCQFGIQADIRILQHWLAGLRAGPLRNKLLRKKDLTISRAVEITRDFEAGDRTSGVLDGPQPAVHALSNQRPLPANADLVCRGCGGVHPQQFCPHKDQACRTCSAVGHLQRMCPTLSLDQRYAAAQQAKSARQRGGSYGGRRGRGQGLGHHQSQQRFQHQQPQGHHQQRWPAPPPPHHAWPPAPPPGLGGRQAAPLHSLLPPPPSDWFQHDSTYPASSGGYSDVYPLLQLSAPPMPPAPSPWDGRRQAATMRALLPQPSWDGPAPPTRSASPSAAEPPTATRRSGWPKPAPPPPALHALTDRARPDGGPCPFPVLPPMLVDVVIEGRHLEMELDSGSPFAVITEDIFRRWWPVNPPPLWGGVRVCSWGLDSLVMVGVMLARVTFNNRTCDVPLRILRGGGGDPSSAENGSRHLASLLQVFMRCGNLHFRPSSSDSRTCSTPPSENSRDPRYPFQWTPPCRRCSPSAAPFRSPSASGYCGNFSSWSAEGSWSRSTTVPGPPRLSP